MKKKKQKSVKIKFCPSCQSTEIDMVAGGNIGLWKCLKCGLQLPGFPEKEISLEKLKKERKNRK